MVMGAGLGAEGVQRDLDRTDGLARGDDERPLEGVPGRVERDDRDRDERRDRDGQHYRPQEANVASAVDPRGVAELPRDGEELLPQEEDREGAGEEGQDLRRGGVGKG